MNRWRDVETVDVASINADLRPGGLTADVMIHHPDNLDPAHRAKVTVDLLVAGFRAAKPIFAEAGVQLRLAGVRTGPLDPALFAVHATDDRHPLPRGRFTGMYRAATRHPDRPSDEARAAFESIVPTHRTGDRTIHLVTLQDVFMTFAEPLDDRTWQWKTIATGGLSFPGYLFGTSLPRHLRGVISITDLTRNEHSWKTVAHELGHKLINVSHEYREIAPQHEVFGEGGLMVYGPGTEIPGGRDGRFHRERLRVSPFLYRLDEGHKQWNPDYAAAGYYDDPIYDGMCLELDPPT